MKNIFKKNIYIPLDEIKIDIISSFSSTILYQYKYEKFLSKIFEFSGFNISFNLQLPKVSSLIFKVFVSNPQSLIGQHVSIKIQKIGTEGEILKEVEHFFSIDFSVEYNAWHSISINNL